MRGAGSVNHACSGATHASALAAVAAARNTNHVRAAAVFANDDPWHTMLRHMLNRALDLHNKLKHAMIAQLALRIFPGASPQQQRTQGNLDVV